MSEQTKLLPPHSEDDEQAALGSMIIDPDAVLLVRDWLSPSDFYLRRNREVCQAIYDLFDKAEPIDYLTIDGRIRRNGCQVDQPHLIGLTTAVPTSIHIQQYARRVLELSTRRQMIQAAQKIAKLAHEEGEINEQMDTAESSILDIRRVNSKDIGIPSVYVREYFDEIMRRSEMDKPLAGPTTSLKMFDELISGFETAQMHIIAARPKMGKSALLMQCARVNAQLGRRALYFSLEMTKNQLMTRNVSSLTGLPTPRLRVGKIESDEWQMFSEACGQLSEIPLYIDDTRAVTPAQISAKARRIYAEFGLDMVLIDYIGLMSPPKMYGNRNAEITEISAALVKLAGDLNVPVIVASQLSRAVEQRSDKHPQLSDLRDSGSLEQDAYTVTFIYRDDYYNPETSLVPGTAELIIAANRGGATGKVTVNWNAQRTLFTDRVIEPLHM